MTELEILNEKLIQTNSRYDILLNQFNDDVAQIDFYRTKILTQIDVETSRILQANCNQSKIN